jgi:hypothetical protein
MWTVIQDRLCKLSNRDRWLLFQSFLLLPAIHYCLALLGYTRLQRQMEKICPLRIQTTPLSDATCIVRAQEISLITSIAAQHGVYKAGCLRRSLLTWWFLRWEGIDSQICFGVRLVNQRFEAHAWVEHNGTIVNDSLAICARFRTLEDILPPTRLGL